MRTCGSGAFPTSASSNSTGTSARKIDELTLICTPARHFSGRFLNRNATLWASWAIIGPAHRAYFGGDTGYTKSFAEIGAEHGPFDVTLMPVGAYNKVWPDIHMNPEEAVQAHVDVNGGLLVPIHWCTFRLAPHPWAEPIERLLAAAEAAERQSGGAETGRARRPNGDCGIRAVVATRRTVVIRLVNNS